MSAIAVRDALIVLLNAAPSSGSANAKTPQEIADLEGALPAYYTTVWLSEKAAEGRRAGGLGSSRAWRLITRAIAQDEDTAQEMRRRADARLREARVTVGGVESTIIVPPEGLSLDPIVPDESWWFGDSEWSFNL